MPDLTFKPVRHDHARFMTRARKRRRFAAAYYALALKYQLARQMLKAYRNAAAPSTY
jgi:hypothetical protein